jgi:hypothetical protein
MIYKLGRLPHNPAKVAKCVQAHNILNLSTLPLWPAARDWSMKDGVDFVYPMLLNDQLGDCVIASLIHKFITSAGQTNTPFAPTEQDALDGYKRFGGYVEGDPSTDRGCVMLDVAKRVCTEPLAGQTIRAFVAVDPTDIDLMAAVCEFFGGLWVGWSLPTAWQDSDIWDVSPTGSVSGPWAPASWGLHATHDPIWSPARAGVRTWTQRKEVTIPAVRTYCEETYAIISQTLWADLVGDRCPAGIDVQQLIDLLPVVGG